MNRIIAATLVLFAIACGAPDEAFEDEELGTLEQPIYVPSKYGIEGVTNWEGHPDFSRECIGTTHQEMADDWCSVPDSKNIKLKWFPSTCPTSGSYGPNTPDGFRSVAYDAIVNWQNEMTLLGWTFPNGDTDPAFTFKCEVVSGTPMGRFQPGPTWETHGRPWGTLGQYRDGKVQIDSADMAGFASSLAPGSATARYWVVFNLIQHELWHLVGLGHSHAGAGPNILNEAPDGTWVVKKGPTASQLDRLDCYNPVNGGLFDDC